MTSDEEQPVPGELVLVAIALLWPVVGGLVVLLRRPGERWRPLAWAAGAGAATAAVALLASFLTFEANGTTAAMTALGGQLLAAACLVGAVISGVLALVLRALDIRAGG